MDIVLSALLYVVAMAVMILAIVKTIYYLIYQRTEKLHVSLFMAFDFEETDFFPILSFKRKKIDETLLYYKKNGYYYILGLQDIYKVKGSKLTVLTEENMTTKEKAFIEGMKKELKDRISKIEGKIQISKDTYNF